MKRKFWNWIKNEDESVPDMERTLFLNGMISDETWYGDEVTPQLFKDELNAGSGNITVWINSPGGDVFAAAQIYNMLRDYKGSVTVKIDGIAASAASVIAIPGAMGDEVFLTYIGLGLPVSIPSLGNLVNDGRVLMMSEPLRYQLLFPAAVIAFITIAFYVIGNAFADASDPKNHV